MVMRVAFRDSVNVMQEQELSCPSSTSSSSDTVVRKMYHPVLFVTLYTMIHICSTAAVTMPQKHGYNKTVPAVLVFGDSIVDPGNNNNRKTPAKSNYPPYGKDFEGGQATGRFSNGVVPSDLIAQWMGVKDLLPAYLDPTLQIEDLLTGVSFASGGAGYDPLTSETAQALSLSDQVDLFKQYLGQLKEAGGEERTAEIISKSVFILCVGSNDIANTYFSTPLRRIQYDISSYTDLLVTYAASFLQDLYELGARRIGVLGLPPLGCVPSQRTLAGGIERICAEPRNQASVLFNTKLSSRLKALSQQLPGSKLIYLDIYYPVIALIENPTQYGFIEVARGCCGTGLIEVTFLCNHYSPGTCRDASKYLFWDSYHPTEKTYRIVVQETLRKNGAELL